MLLPMQAISVRLRTVATTVKGLSQRMVVVRTPLVMEVTLVSLQTAVMISVLALMLLMVEDILGSSRIVAIMQLHVRVLPSYLKNNESSRP